MKVERKTKWLPSQRISDWMGMVNSSSKTKYNISIDY